jgi:hypothetical protein
MNIVTINKPAPHCVIPVGHPCHRGYVPAAETDIRRTFTLAEIGDIRDDYELVQQQDWMSAPGGFRS